MEREDAAAQDAAFGEDGTELPGRTQPQVRRQAGFFSHTLRNFWIAQTDRR